MKNTRTWRTKSKLQCIIGGTGKAFAYNRLALYGCISYNHRSNVIPLEELVLFNHAEPFSLYTEIQLWLQERIDQVQQLYQTVWAEFLLVGTNIGHARRTGENRLQKSRRVNQKSKSHLFFLQISSFFPQIKVLSHGQTPHSKIRLKFWTRYWVLWFSRWLWETWAVWCRTWICTRPSIRKSLTERRPTWSDSHVCIPFSQTKAWCYWTPYRFCFEFKTLNVFRNVSTALQQKIVRYFGYMDNEGQAGVNAEVRGD